MSLYFDLRNDLRNIEKFVRLLDRFPPLFTMIGTGFCGSMTTWSTMAHDTFTNFANLDEPSGTSRFSGVSSQFPLSLPFFSLTHFPSIVPIRSSDNHDYDDGINHIPPIRSAPFLLPPSPLPPLLSSPSSTLKAPLPPLDSPWTPLLPSLTIPPNLRSFVLSIPSNIRNSPRSIRYHPPLHILSTPQFHLSPIPTRYFHCERTRNSDHSDHFFTLSTSKLESLMCRFERIGGWVLWKFEYD